MRCYAFSDFSAQFLVPASVRVLCYSPYSLFILVHPLSLPSLLEGMEM